MVGDLNKQFGSRLRELRKRQGLTQEQLAERAGLHYKFLGRVERGTDIKLSNIAKIANGLEISIGELLIYCFPKKMLTKKKEKLLENFMDLLEKSDEAKVEKLLKFIDEFL